MTITLAVFLVIALGVIVQQQRYRKRLTTTSTRLIGNLNYENQRLKDRIHEEVQNYHALEIGQQEIVDNYENDFLDLRAKAETASNSAAYDRMMREQTDKLLALQNEVIEKHAEHCDDILQEIADAIVADILPDKEKKENDMTKITHNHASDERCDENGCTEDRYVDGKHVFTDTMIVTAPADEEPVTPADE